MKRLAPAQRLCRLAAVILCSLSIAAAQSGGYYVIDAIAGPGSVGDGGAATAAWFHQPFDVVLDAGGNLYIADSGNHRIRRVDADGNIATFAGSGLEGFSGDGGPASAARLSAPRSVALDAGGNLYIADTGNQRVRKVDAATGNISTIAGTGSSGGSGDGGPASAARLFNPAGLALDSAGNLYIAHRDRVRKVDAATGVISTFAGTGLRGDSGDGGAATAAQLDGPADIALDAAGNLYIADLSNHRIRKVDAATGVISTFAGTGMPGHTGDGGAATAARIFSPRDAAADADGNIYIAHSAVVRKVDTAGNISTIAGTATAGHSGDGGPATAAQMRTPSSVAADADSNIHIVDTNSHRVRKIDAATGNISTIAGDGTYGFSGDGGPATAAHMRLPSSVAADADGNLYIADQSNRRIRKVDAATGAISTIAGDGEFGSSGDGGRATAARMYYPSGLIVDGDGRVYFADQGARRIRRLIPAAALSALPPPRITLQAQPSSVAPGREAALTWTASGAATVTIDQGLGEMTPPAAGSVLVRPRRTTTYTAVARSASGREAAASAAVTVIGGNETGPEVYARPLKLSFALPQDAAPASQTAVLFVDDGELDWSVSSSARWLIASPRQGSLSPGREQTLTVSADPAGMRTGAHRARLFVRAEGRVSAQIRVSLDVLPPRGPAVSEHGVVNAAVRSAFGRPGLFGPRLLPLAPGSLAAVHGVNFLPDGAAPRIAEALPLPTALGGVRVLFDGIAARLRCGQPPGARRRPGGNLRHRAGRGRAALGRRHELLSARRHELLSARRRMPVRRLDNRHPPYARPPAGMDRRVPTGRAGHPVFLPGAELRRGQLGDRANPPKHPRQRRRRSGHRRRRPPQPSRSDDGRRMKPAAAAPASSLCTIR